MSPPALNLLTRPWCVALSLYLWSAFPARAASTFTFNGAVTNQVIEGFGVNINHRGWTNDDLKPVVNALVDQAGMTLFRVIYDKTDWEATNDNSDPTVFNWNYYNQVYTSPDFQKLWGLMGYLNQKGISNGLMLNFQGNGPAWLGVGKLGNGEEAEWAEMIGSLLIYAAITNQLNFGLVGPDNEMDTDVQGVVMSATQYTNSLDKLARLLDSNGVTGLRFVGPDLAGAGTNFMPEMMGDSELMSKVTHFGLHSYASEGLGTIGVANYIHNSAYPDRTFWMTEFNVACPQCDAGISGTNTWDYASEAVANLLSYLANGASAGIVWEAYDSQYNYFTPLQWSFWGLFAVNDTTAIPKTYTPRKEFYTLSQVSRWVRPGAQMIGVSGPASFLSPLLAFKNSASGQITIVGVNNSGNAVALNGTLASLPLVNQLDLYYTSATTNLAYAGSAAVSNGTFTVSIPGDCVFTLSGTPGASSTITSPALGTQYTAPATIPMAASALTTTGVVSRVEFFAGSTKLGESTNPPYQFTWTNVLMGDYLLTSVAMDTIGNRGTSAPVTVAVAGPIGQISVSPVSAVVFPGSTQQFTATAFDVLGHELSVQPSFSWSNCCGGSIDGTGRFTPGPFVGGLLTVIAGSGGIAGTASVTLLPPGGSILGNTNNGTQTDSIWDGAPWINAARIVAASRMTAATIYAKVTASVGNYKCAVYTDNSGVPRSFLAGSSMVSNPPDGWATFPLTPSVVFTNGQPYWLAIWSDSADAGVYTSTGSGQLRWGQYNFGNWPNPITTTGGGSDNYCIFARSAGGRPPPLGWPPAAPITYGTAIGSLQFNATSSVPGSFTYYPPSNSVPKAGLGRLLTLCFLPQDTNTYLGTITNLPIDVLPAPLSITVLSAHKVFGAPLPSGSFFYSGFVSGDTPASLTSLPSLSTPATTNSDVGTYTLSGTGASSPNYSIQYHSATLTITPAKTTGALSSSANPLLPLAPVTLTYNLSPVPPGAGVPTGNVDFLFDELPLATGVQLVGGAASYMTAGLLAGRHNLQAVFAGSLNFTGTTNTLVPDLMVVPQPKVSIQWLLNGSVVLGFSALPNETYYLQYSKSLTSPDWQDIVVANADNSGVLLYTNVIPPNSPWGFYRAVYR